MRVDPRVFETGHVATGQQQQFIVSRPKATHFEQISCKESKCRHYMEGWRTIVTTNSIQDNYIRRESGRKFVVESVADGLTRFRFGAEQQCFRWHGRPRDRREYFGHRPSPRSSVFAHERPEDWIEQYNIEQDKTQRVIKRG